MYTVIAKIIAKPEFTKELKESLEALIEPTIAEHGCIKYILHESVDDPCLFMFYEIWQSKQACDFHLNSAHIKNWVEISKPFLQSWELFFLRAISTAESPAIAD